MEIIQEFHGEVLIKHPTEQYEVNEIKLNNGNVNIVKYSNDTVIVIITEQNQPRTIWCNRPIYINKDTDEVSIISQQQFDQLKFR